MLTLRHQLDEKQGRRLEQQREADGAPAPEEPQSQPAGDVRRHLHGRRDEAAHVGVGVQPGRVEGEAVVSGARGEPAQGDVLNAPRA